MDTAPQKMIRLLLNKEFYENHKHKVVKEMFPDSLGAVYEAIKEGHTRYGRTLTLDDIKALYKILNPAATTATRNNIYELLFEISTDEAPLNQDIAKDVLEYMWRTEVFRRLAEQAVDGMNGKVVSLTGIQRILEEHGDDFLPVEDIQELDSDFDTIMQSLADRAGWRFNIPSLAKRVSGGSGGDLMIVFARPEVGKTAFHTSLSCAPDGFCHQGAHVLCLLNEEKGSRTQARGISACSGLSADQILEDPVAAATATQTWAKIRSRFHVIDNVDMTMERLDVYCKRHKPDILIVDQLDKVHVAGTFARDDQRLKEVYRQAREIAKRHNIFVIGLCQASADAEGKTKLNYSMMDGSKTGKAGEADLIIGVGKKSVDEVTGTSVDDDNIRYLTLSKNKITGWHGTLMVALDAPLSTYHD